MKISTRLFLHWHATNKMRLGDFKGASVIYDFLHAEQALRKESYFAYAYCLMRQEKNSDVESFINQLQHLDLDSQEKELLLRLQRRMEVQYDGLE